MHFSEPNQQGCTNEREGFWQHLRPSSSCFHRTGYNYSPNSQVGDCPAGREKPSIVLSPYLAHTAQQLMKFQGTVESSASDHLSQKTAGTELVDTPWHQAHFQLVEHLLSGKSSVFWAKYTAGIGRGGVLQALEANVPTDGKDQRNTTKIEAEFSNGICLLCCGVSWRHK